MARVAKPLTKEELAALPDLPQAYKDAIECSLLNWSDPDDPEDKVWPDYFRGEVVESLRGCAISDDDELVDDEYDTKCVWFQCGWKARERAAAQGRLV